MLSIKLLRQLLIIILINFKNLNFRIRNICLMYLMQYIHSLYLLCKKLFNITTDFIGTAFKYWEAGKLIYRYNTKFYFYLKVQILTLVINIFTCLQAHFINFWEKICQILGEYAELFVQFYFYVKMVFHDEKG